MNDSHEPIRTAILAAIKQPEGMTTTKVAGFTREQVGRMVEKLQRAGMIFRAPMPGKVGRYFDTMERAQAFADQFSGNPVEGVVIKKSKAWAPEAPMVIPEGLKVKYGAGVPDRWAPSKNDESWRLFSSLKPGQYLEAA